MPKLPSPTPRTATEIAVIVLAVLAVVATAHFAKPFLIPVVVGILLSYTLRPLVSQLERIRVPRVAGSAVVIAVLVSLVSATVYAIRDDVNRAVAELPEAARKLRYAAAESERKSPGPMTHVKEAAAELDKAAAEAAGRPQPAAPAPSTPGHGRAVPEFRRRAVRTGAGGDDADFRGVAAGVLPAGGGRHVSAQAGHASRAPRSRAGASPSRC